MTTEEKKELDHYRKLFSVSEHDIAMQGYLSYVNIVGQMVDYIKNFKIKENIDGKKTETVMYDRTEKIWTNLPEMISSMNKLKEELKIEFNPEEGKVKPQATRPESIAKQLG